MSDRPRTRPRVGTLCVGGLKGPPAHVHNVVAALHVDDCENRPRPNRGPSDRPLATSYHTLPSVRVSFVFTFSRTILMGSGAFCVPTASR
ncbi:hypothetical protein Pan44_49580 [Caulifigura coniformis]|uniref:Uncharacterized protein n=1 Tax=Caulifigura coniformis TaxID=2527983 RepID=A0A517SLA8_9PLAN|nr:hypothetical protein Pan44_49580 [Caulifigura coniformis]